MVIIMVVWLVSMPSNPRPTKTTMVSLSAEHRHSSKYSSRVQVRVEEYNACCKRHEVGDHKLHWVAINRGEANWRLELMMDLVNMAIQKTASVKHPMAIKKKDLVDKHAHNRAQENLEWPWNFEIRGLKRQGQTNCKRDERHQACVDYKVADQLSHTGPAV